MQERELWSTTSVESTTVQDNIQASELQLNLLLQQIEVVVLVLVPLRLLNW